MCAGRDRFVNNINYIKIRKFSFVAIFVEVNFILATQQFCYFQVQFFNSNEMLSVIRDYRSEIGEIPLIHTLVRGGNVFGRYIGSYIS